MERGSTLAAAIELPHRDGVPDLAALTAALKTLRASGPTAARFDIELGAGSKVPHAHLLAVAEAAVSAGWLEPMVLAPDRMSTPRVVLGD